MVVEEVFATHRAARRAVAEAQVLVMQAERDDLMPQVQELRLLFITAPWRADYLRAVRRIALEFTARLKN
ncbi:hypothetical protein [Deinococcus peraridilitoris]|uniref:Uncharacterized protein n=1 Tax=Deinococcus peraridilitoris (strain DSM 19664 / LMG 22246 / CIP 109416 / KR-200) TaxID=937777 RepID=L0A1I8_DEIPD|nr:hypothetical protein [Deinococcus peraridilitoris]AFZ67042.1 hypothetical protein Deipe_1501 [Deinococcus peraridilitoris DSM 19664]